MLWDTVFPLSPHCFVCLFFPKRKKHAWEKNTNVSATCNSYKSSLLASLSPCAFNPSCTSVFKRKASNSTKLHQYRLHGSKETLIPQVPTSSSKTMLLAVISHSHQSHISIKQDCFLLTASLTQHNKGNFSPQRPHLEIQGLTLGMGIRKRRGQISRALPDWYLSTKPRNDGVPFCSSGSLSCYDWFEIYPFPKRLLKKKEISQSCTVCSLTLSFPPLLPQLTRGLLYT